MYGEGVARPREAGDQRDAGYPGLQRAIAVGIEIDSIGHLAEPVLEINRQIRERGLRPTIEARSAGELDLELGRRPQGGEAAMRVAITGSSGLIGTALRARLEEEGHEVLSVLRGPEDDPDASWDPAEGWIRAGVFAGFDAVVNLSGASIGEGRWSASRRELLHSSRIETTRVLVDHLASLTDGERPKVLVNQSAVGFYGDRGDEELTEGSPRGEGFLADLVADWEQEAQRAEEHGIRTVRHRSAIVLSKEGPPLSRMLLPFRLGLGGNLGNGRWWMPWITLEDELRSLEHALTSELSGPVNAAAPGAVTNAALTKAIGRALHRPTLFMVPGFAFKLMFGQDPAEIFASQRVMPLALQESGFEFSHPEIDGALETVLAG